jgi:hypothetical protein
MSLVFLVDIESFLLETEFTNHSDSWEAPILMGAGWKDSGRIVYEVGAHLCGPVANPQDGRVLVGPA